MDGERFDAWVRVLAAGASRRGALRAIGAGLVAAALAPRGTTALDRRPCPRGSRQCEVAFANGGGPCCDGVCCGTKCCPPETVGCTQFDAGNGAVVIGCLCPPGLEFRDGRCVGCALCRPGVGCCAPLDAPCTRGLPCCSGSCVAGVCRCHASGESCAEHYDCCDGACVAGVCQARVAGAGCDSTADCGPGLFCSDAQTCQPCETGVAICAGLGVDFVIDSCPWSLGAYCCSGDAATGFSGFGYCCVPGENCPGDACGRACPTASAFASAGC